MKATGILLGSAGVQTGAAALILYVLNMLVWSVLAALLGGALGLIGLGLILWALYPLRGRAVAADAADPQADGGEAQAA